jgi:hypothetical protein
MSPLETDEEIEMVEISKGNYIEKYRVCVSDMVTIELSINFKIADQLIREFVSSLDDARVLNDLIGGCHISIFLFQLALDILGISAFYGGCCPPINEPDWFQEYLQERNYPPLDGSSGIDLYYVDPFIPGKNDIIINNITDETEEWAPPKFELDVMDEVLRDLEHKRLSGWKNIALALIEENKKEGNNE